MTPMLLYFFFLSFRLTLYVIRKRVSLYPGFLFGLYDWFWGGGMGVGFSIHFLFIEDECVYGGGVNFIFAWFGF